MAVAGHLTTECSRGRDGRADAPREAEKSASL